MKYLKKFTGFVNEQEEKKPTPSTEKPGMGSGIDTTGLADIFKNVGQIFKDAGFLPGNPDDPESGGMSWGGRLQASGQYKVPTAEDVKKGVDAVNQAMDRHGITDKNMRASIQGVIGKECGWAPKNEYPYNNTSNDRIRKVFGKRVASLSDGELNSLKSNIDKFWDRVYGPDDPTGNSQKYGNTNPGDGAKYLGRGFNGITFKSGYQKMQELYNRDGKLGRSINFLTNPDALNDLDVAAEVAVLYFIENLKNPKVKSLYGSNDPNEFPDKDSALKAVFHVNAGLGQDLSRPIFQETLAKSTDFRDDMLAKNMV
jgi:predicted chitinase